MRWMRRRGDRVRIISGKYARHTGTIESNVYQRTVDYPDELDNSFHIMLDTGVLVTVRWEQVEGAGSAIPYRHGNIPGGHPMTPNYGKEDEAFMKYSIPGLGGRLRRARNATGLSQEAVANKIGISWMTVHRWERSQRGVPDHLLNRVCELYNRPLGWFLTLEEGDLGQENESSGSISANPAGSAAAERIRRKIADGPASQRAMIEKVVEDMLDGLTRGA